MPGGKRKPSNLGGINTTINTTTRTESDQPLTKKFKTKKEASKKRNTIQMESIENPKTEKRLRKEEYQIDNIKVIKSKTIKKKTKKKAKIDTTSTKTSTQPADHDHDPINGGKLGHTPMDDMHMHWCPRHFHDSWIRKFVLQYKSGIVQHCQGELDEDNILKRLEYRLPYVFNPKIEEGNLKKQNTFEVDIMFAQEPSLPVMCVFDWEIDQLVDFANDRIEEGELCADRKDEFKEYVRGQACEVNRKIKELTNQLITEVARAAFDSMRFYKFYPIQTSGAPQFQKDSTINRYYGKAHEVL